MNIDAPLSWVEVEGCQRPLLAEQFELINPFVATVVASVGQTLRVLVGEDGAIGLHGCPTRQVLGETMGVLNRFDRIGGVPQTQ